MEDGTWTERERSLRSYNEKYLPKRMPLTEECKCGHNDGSNIGRPVTDKLAQAHTIDLRIIIWSGRPPDFARSKTTKRARSEYGGCASSKKRNAPRLGSPK